MWGLKDIFKVSGIVCYFDVKNYRYVVLVLDDKFDILFFNVNWKMRNIVKVVEN